ncbi:hypothetical protein K2P47_00015 [Patescibacteria group bacterium]|nr:hypothetical protein [Patescibacteria group bacterium]
MTMQAGPVSTNTRLKSLMGSKWLVWSLLGFGIILLVLNLFIGGDSAPVTTSTEATQGENLPTTPPPATNDIVVSGEENPLSDIWQWAVSEENSWIVSGMAAVALIAIIFFLMRYSGVSAGKLSRTSVTIIGYLVLGVLIILFNLLPTDIIMELSGIIMLILGGMVLLSLVMLITGWGNKLAWVVLLVGFGTLMFNPVESTATRVTETARTIQEEGLKGIAPNVTPMVPDIIYMSPEEKVAARKAEAEELKRQQELARIQAEGEARARVAAEVAAARELEETMMDAKAKPCVRRYKDELNCFTVTFGVNTKYDREALPPTKLASGKEIGYCIIADPGEPTVTREDLGGGQHRYTGSPGLVVQFFDVPVGRFGCGS